MKRRLFYITALMSLLLAVATAIVWHRSKSVGDWGYYKRVDRANFCTRSIGFYSDYGQVMFTFDYANYHDAETFEKWRPALHLETGISGGGFGTRYRAEAFSWLHPTAGFGWQALRDEPREGATHTTYTLLVPYWSLVVVLTILPCAGIVTAVRRRFPSQNGRCPVCGYDLRATPERCPECGVGPPVAAAPRTAA